VLRTVVFLIMTSCKLVASYAGICAVCIEYPLWAPVDSGQSCIRYVLIHSTCVCDVAVRLQYSVCRRGIEWSVSFTYSLEVLYEVSNLRMSVLDKI